MPQLVLCDLDMSNDCAGAPTVNRCQWPTWVVIAVSISSSSQPQNKLCWLNMCHIVIKGAWDELLYPFWGWYDSSSNCFRVNQTENQFLVSLEKCDANYYLPYIHTTTNICDTMSGTFHMEIPANTFQWIQWNAFNSIGAILNDCHLRDAVTRNVTSHKNSH